MGRQTKSDYMAALSQEIARLGWGQRHDNTPIHERSLWFWDRESLYLVEHQTGSGLMQRLGNMPVVRDVRPEPEARQKDLMADREARARAGHCGDMGDM
jgi:hypothetical protein